MARSSPRPAPLRSLRSRSARTQPSARRTMRSRTRKSHDESKIQPAPVVDETEQKPLQQEPEQPSAPFRLMDLPPEIRLEIYRACLTRPFDILMSRREQPRSVSNSAEGPSTDPEDTDDSLDRSGSFLSSTSSSSSSSSSTPCRPAPPRRRHTLHPTAPSLASRAPSSSPSSSARPPAPPSQAQLADPLLINLLRASRAIYREARAVLYGENVFSLDPPRAAAALAALHQRSRRQIQHVRLAIPAYTDILEAFQETVRLGLRYCHGLRSLVVHVPFLLPGVGSGNVGNSAVYANGFDILRWLPQKCDVLLTGEAGPEIEAVVRRHRILARTLDANAYARRQLISNESAPLSVEAEAEAASLPVPALPAGERT